MTRDEPDMAIGLRRKIAAALILAAAAAATCVGWMVFWFLTDDAFISFRYISNSMRGYGYVWNAPPFLPVEGYTNFLWIVILDWIWRLLGIAPPDSANSVSLIFSLGSLAVAAAMLMRMKLRPALERHRLAFLALALAGVVTNRTFLAWTSSGLETAMFNFFLTAWVFCAVSMTPRSVTRAAGISAFCALMSLTRPDGLLFILPTLALVLISAGQARGRERLKLALGGMPLMAVAAHLLWRRWFYGEWLPNTYYAKYDRAWPEAGIRYALSFALEYALWVWMALCGWVVWRSRHGIVALLDRAMKRLESGAGLLPSDFSRLPGWTPAALVALPLAAHVAYYALIMGGDHFEYRVYSHLIVLAFVGFVWLVNKSSIHPGAGIAWLAAFLLLSWPVPWTHWKLSQRLTTRAATFTMEVSVARHWPPVVRGYAAWFDDLQFWLIEHFVCMRHQEHKVFWQWLLTHLPSRDEGSRLPGEAFPVAVGYSVGVMSWVLPQIDIIDLYGLNDYVIARSPPDQIEVRRMAHTKRPPQGYILSFSPNVTVSNSGKVEIQPRYVPLSPDDIRRYETTWRAQVRAPNPRPYPPP